MALEFDGAVQLAARPIGADSKSDATMNLGEGVQLSAVAMLETWAIQPGVRLQGVLAYGASGNLMLGYSGKGHDHFQAAAECFAASWGIVVASVYTGVMALIPEPQASNLLQIIELLEMERVDMDSPLFEKISGRYGVAGYSNGTGGCLIAAAQDPSLRTSMILAGTLLTSGGAGIAQGTRAPTLMLCGSADVMGSIDQSQQIYDVVSGTAPALLIEILNATNLSWLSPSAAGGGTSGGYALAFQKVFLEGDERWRPLLLNQPENASQWRTNIQ